MECGSPPQSSSEFDKKIGIRSVEEVSSEKGSKEQHEDEMCKEIKD